MYDRFFASALSRIASMTERKMLNQEGARSGLWASALGLRLKRVYDSIERFTSRSWSLVVVFVYSDGIALER